MKTAIAWVIRIIGLVVGTLFWSVCALIIGAALWMKLSEAVYRHGATGAMAAAFFNVCSIAAGVGGIVLCIASFVWASDHLKR